MANMAVSGTTSPDASEAVPAEEAAEAWADVVALVGAAVVMPPEGLPEAPGPDDVVPLPPVVALADVAPPPPVVPVVAPAVVEPAVVA